jgi:hypothetical protein
VLRPTAAGTASVALAYEGSPLSGLPADFTVMPGPVVPELSVLWTLPPEVLAGTSVTAEVMLKDEFGNLVRAAPSRSTS